jgi:hypothetical protein
MEEGKLGSTIAHLNKHMITLKGSSHPYLANKHVGVIFARR